MKKGEILLEIKNPETGEILVIKENCYIQNNELNNLQMKKLLSKKTAKKIRSFYHITPDKIKDLDITLSLPREVENIGYLNFKYTNLMNSINEIKAPGFKITPTLFFKKFASLERVYLPNVLEVFPLTFNKCHNLKSVVFNKVETIGVNSFCDCNALEEVNGLYNLKELRECAFADTAIKTIKLPYRIKNLPYACFRNCQNLEHIDGQFKVVKEHCFRNCKKLKQFPNMEDLTEISSSAFSYSGIEKIALNNSVSLGIRPFKDCLNVSSIQVPEELEYNLIKENNLPCLYLDINLKTKIKLLKEKKEELNMLKFQKEKEINEYDVQIDECQQKIKKLGV